MRKKSSHSTWQRLIEEGEGNEPQTRKPVTRRGLKARCHNEYVVVKDGAPGEQGNKSPSEAAWPVFDDTRAQARAASMQKRTSEFMTTHHNLQHVAQPMTRNEGSGGTQDAGAEVVTSGGRHTSIPAGRQGKGPKRVPNSSTSPSRLLTKALRSYSNIHKPFWLS